MAFNGRPFTCNTDLWSLGISIVETMLPNNLQDKAFPNGVRGNPSRIGLTSDYFKVMRHKRPEFFDLICRLLVWTTFYYLFNWWIFRPVLFLNFFLSYHELWDFTKSVMRQLRLLKKSWNEWKIRSYRSYHSWVTNDKEIGASAPSEMGSKEKNGPKMHLNGQNLRIFSVPIKVDSYTVLKIKAYKA